MWADAPTPGPVVAPVVPTAKGRWVEIDVTGAVTGDGTYRFVPAGARATSLWFSSRQGTNPPELVVSTG